MYRAVRAVVLCGGTVHLVANRLLGTRPRRVLVAYGCYCADLSHAPEHVGSYVGTTRLVTEIFRQ